MPTFTLIATSPPDLIAPFAPIGALGRDDGTALTVERNCPDVDEAVQHFEQLLAEIDRSEVDVNVIAGAPKPRKLLIADMESTIIEQEMLDELADYVGKRTEVEAITAKAMRGELDFERAITERVALLHGLDASVLDDVLRERLTFMPGARELVATMKASGAYCALVSGGFTHFTAHVADELGFDEHRANVLEIVDGKLSGKVVPPILGREAKLSALHEITARIQIELDDAIAVGDGANDLAMLHAAGLGVAYRAKPQVRDAMASAGNGAVITHCDLTGLLYLQGFASNDVVRHQGAH